MAQKNIAVKTKKISTHENAPAARINAENSLRRSVLSCLLWEKEFYEGGETIAERIAALVPQVAPQKVSLLAIEAREKMHLRHVPLFLVREMVRHESHRPFVEETLARVVQRADELTEFVALYWGEGQKHLPHSVRRGLAKAFRKFNEYQFAKYDRDNAVKLRDVLRLVHPVPENEEQGILWGKVAKRELATPDTWEVSLSAKDGIEKKEKWERLLQENKLGGLALLRNLRNMRIAGVDKDLVAESVLRGNYQRVLPFRFIAAAQNAGEFEPELETAMLESLREKPKIAGRTAILVDVSGSMAAPLSSRSDMRREDAAYGVAIVGRELFEKVDIYTFSRKTIQIPARRGFALRDAMHNSQEHGGTYIGEAVSTVWKNSSPQRMIVITDEQSHDQVNYPKGLEKGYMINVASYQNGVGYGQWTHIDGFSESVFEYIREIEEG